MHTCAISCVGHQIILAINPGIATIDVWHNHHTLTNMKERLKMVSTIKLETGIPIPDDATLGNDSRRSPYPFDSLEPQGSFSYPLLTGSEAMNRQWRAAKSAIFHYKKSVHPLRNFLVRPIPAEGVMRIWRLADDTPPKPPSAPLTHFKKPSKPLGKRG